ncbi:unnamed protein product [Urochloa humidicola]
MERQSASSSSSPDAGQERVMAAAKHIVKSLAVSKNAADDMMHFLSTFDPRLHPLSSPETGDEASNSGRGGGDADEEEEEEIAAVEEVIRRCNSMSSSSSGMIGMADYLYAVDDAIAASGHSARAAAAVHAAMPRLEEEARSLLSSSSPLQLQRRLSLSSDDAAAAADESPPSPLSPDAAAAARAVAARMLRAGYGPELAQVFVAARRDALAESVALLGVEPVSIEEVMRMEWGALDQRMRRWSHAVGAVVGTLLAGERRLCDEVFAGEPDGGDEELGHECFADVARGCVLQLLGFADAVAVSARATERLYRTLGMYEALAAARPGLEALFAGGDSAARDFFADEAASAAEQLGSALRRTIEEFGRAIHGEASRKAVHGGEIHPMTRYVLNYCGLLADSRRTLDAVLGDAGLDDDEDEVNGGGAAEATPAARCIRELLTLLLGKVEEKARLYDDAGLQNIFLMNNVYYVVQKVRESPPLRELVGDDWLRRHRGQIRQYETAYLRASWMAVLSTHLRRDGGGGGAGARAAAAAQGPSAKGFNAAFQEVYRAQTAWKVTDPQLREELRIAVSERLIPAYRAFLGQGSRHPARHVKCSLEDLEDYMLDFFEGVPKLVRW